MLNYAMFSEAIQGHMYKGSRKILAGEGGCLFHMNKA